MGWIEDVLDVASRTPVIDRPASGLRKIYRGSQLAPGPLGDVSRLIDEIQNPFRGSRGDTTARIRRFAPDRRQVAVQPAPGGPGGTDLFEQLLGMLTGGVGVDEADLMNQIRRQFDPVYDARVAAIQSMMQRAQQRTSRGREDVEAMYEALGQDYERLAPEAAEQAEEAQAEVEDLYGQLRSNIEGNYSRIAQEQEEMFEQLGIEAAAPEVMEPQSERATEAMNRAAELEAINAQRYQDIGNIDESYYRQGAPLARLTGSNRSSEMLSRLQDYMAQRQSEIAAAEAERTAGIQGAFTQLLQQARGQAAQQQSQQAGMLWNILQAQMEAQQPQEMTSDLFLSQLQPQLREGVSSAFRSLERSPEAVFGKVEDPRNPTPGTFVPVTEEWWLNSVDEMHQRGQISDATRQALIQFLRMRFAEGA